MGNDENNKPTNPILLNLMNEVARLSAESARQLSIIQELQARTNAYHCVIGMLFANEPLKLRMLEDYKQGIAKFSQDHPSYHPLQLQEFQKVLRLLEQHSGQTVEDFFQSLGKSIH